MRDRDWSWVNNSRRLLHQKSSDGAPLPLAQVRPPFLPLNPFVRASSSRSCSAAMQCSLRLSPALNPQSFRTAVPLIFIVAHRFEFGLFRQVKWLSILPRIFSHRYSSEISFRGPPDDSLLRRLVDEYCNPGFAEIVIVRFRTLANAAPTESAIQQSNRKPCGT